VDANRQNGSAFSGRFGAGSAQPGTNQNANDPNAWRMVRYNNEWWYYTPQNSWMYYRDNNWSAYDPGTFRPLQRYRTAFRGLNQNIDERGEMRVSGDRNENGEMRIDARQENRNQLQQNRDNARDQRREMRSDIQDNRSMNQSVLPNITPQSQPPTRSSTPGTQILSLPTPGTTNTDGPSGGVAGGH